MTRGPQGAPPPDLSTWKNAAGIPISGGGTWTSYMLDPKTGQLYVPGGNPAPDFAIGVREGENLYTDSVVVLDAKTGNYKHHCKLVPKDWHDWNVSNPSYGGSGRSDVLRTRASWNHRNNPSRGGGRNRSFALCSRALDSLFGTDLKKPTPRNDMPAFDAANVLGVFMWQGGWAALAAFGLLAALVAMSQAIVVATSAGAKEMLAAISAIKNQAG